LDNTLLINERVEVVAVFKKTADPGLLCFPAKMKYRNQLIEFSELGLRHPTTKGRKMIHVFDMSDGANDYRLEFDAESLTWTLIAIMEASYVGH
jgi:hypothetical protein